MLTFSFTGAASEMTTPEILTAGMVGKPVRFVFSPEWADLRKNAVYQAGDVRLVHLDVGETDVIPWEVLENPLVPLTVGIWGTSPDGQVVIPTIRALGPEIQPGVDPDGDPGTEASLPVWAQLQAMIGDLSLLETDETENLVAAVNNAYTSGMGAPGRDGFTFFPAVSDAGYLSWRNNGGLPNPAPVCILGPQGEKGDTGPRGEIGLIGPQGPQGEPGAGMDVTGAVAGQIVKIAAVDENGVPTAWEPVDMPSGGGSSWELVADMTLEEDVAELSFTGLSASELQFAYEGRFNNADDSMSNADMNGLVYLNNDGYPVCAPQLGFIRPAEQVFLCLGTVHSIAGHLEVITRRHNGSTVANATFSGRGHVFAPITAIKLTTNYPTTLFKAGGRFTLFRKA